MDCGWAGGKDRVGVLGRALQRAEAPCGRRRAGANQDTGRLHETSTCKSANVLPPSTCLSAADSDHHGEFIREQGESLVLTLDRHGLHLHHRGHFLRAHMVASPLPKPGQTGRKDVSPRAASVTEDRSSTLPHDRHEGEEGRQDDHEEQDQHDHQTQLTFTIHRNN